MILIAIILYGCGNPNPEPDKTDNVTATVTNPSPSPMQQATRWYPAELVLHGSRIYQKHCQTCHGVNASGFSQEWRTVKSNGRFLPPPLNGSAQSWQQSLPALIEIIDMGSIASGGEMPAFVTSLSIDEKLSVIAYFQQFWPDETYLRWTQNFPNQFKR